MVGERRIETDLTEAVNPLVKKEKEAKTREIKLRHRSLINGQCPFVRPVSFCTLHFLVF